MVPQSVRAAWCWCPATGRAWGEPQVLLERLREAESGEHSLSRSSSQEVLQAAGA